MTLTRRELGRIALASIPAGQLLAAAMPNSIFGGVRIGVITYSFRALPGSAEQTLNYCLECGISGVEMMSNVAESYAGAPLPAGRGGFGQPPARAGAAGSQAGPGQPPPGGAAPGAQGRGGRAQMTPEQQEAQRKAAEALREWRLSVPMDKYKALRKMYENAGVQIYAFKLPPTMQMSDDEYNYIWNVAEALGADHVTMELPTDDALLKRVADFAARRKLRIAFHTHGQGGESGFERVLAASKYTALNFDVGHFYGVNGVSPVPVMVRYHDRIASLHLKDRKGPSSSAEGRGGPGGGGPNMPWGQGETPLVEVLQTMRKNKYTFWASIEYEYQTPEGSDVLTEIKKCVEFCRKALS